MLQTAPTLNRGDTNAIGAREGREAETRSVKSDEEEAGSDKVTASTRAFEEIDAQVFPGPGRGATRSEAVASDSWGGPSPGTVEAYHQMINLLAKHRHANSELRTSLMNTSKR